jgi:predicted RNase H-like HicB family nuclease
MFSEYIEAALEKVVYKTIDDEEPIFVSVPELQGAWATGKTIEEARKELISVIEGWIALRLRMGRSIPSIGGHVIIASDDNDISNSHSFSKSSASKICLAGPSHQWPQAHAGIWCPFRSPTARACPSISRNRPLQSKSHRWP